MASPQTEDGFVRIATELYNALCNLRIPGEARQVFDTIVRFTYGYNQTRNTISMKQFVQTTGLSKVAICKAVKKLNQMNVIVTQKGNVTQLGNRIAGTYWIQKNYDKWKPLPKKVTVTQKGKKPLPKKRGSIDNTTKDNIAIPPYLNKPPFIEAWSEWLKHRADIKKILTERSVKMQFKQLTIMGIDRAVRAIEFSIANGYTGIFEPKSERGSQNQAGYDEQGKLKVVV